MPGEFELIKAYFQQRFSASSSVTVGIGDDAAVTKIPPGHELVTTVDTLVAGGHFPIETQPEDIGFKSLAVSLSDLAAMSASPLWFTLALTLPQSDSDWLQRFSTGLLQAADYGGISLIGGDTTRGHLSITIQAMGQVEEGKAVLRSGAQPGDDVYVTGTLGDAAAGLAVIQNRLSVSEEQQRSFLNRLNRPSPRTSAGLALAGLVTSMIDCSDGLAADLGHILEQSEVGAELFHSQLPLSQAFNLLLNEQEKLGWSFSGGDDYELIFTAPQSCQAQIDAIAQTLDHACTRIGRITSATGLRLLNSQGEEISLPQTGFQHF